MRCVTQTDCLGATFGNEQAIRILADAGYDALDMTLYTMVNDDDNWCRDDWREQALKLKEVARECKIDFSQAHAPFPTTRGEEPFDTVTMERIIRSMEIASILGVKNIVVHPKHHVSYVKNKKWLFDINVQMYKDLIPYCEKYNIHVCIENMWQYDEKRHIIVDSVCAQPEEFCAMIDAVSSPWIVACLDIGHCALVGVDPADMIRALGHNRLKALHVHDVDHLHDCHTLPYMEELDWNSITSALAEIDYSGDFTFEADNFLWKLPKELRLDGVSFMEKTGRHLVGLIEQNRK